MNKEIEPMMDKCEAMMEANGEGQGKPQGEAEGVTLPNGVHLTPAMMKQFDAHGKLEDVFETQQKPRELPPPIIDGMMLQREFVTLTSDSKARKSFFLLQMAFCVACGYPFFGLKTYPVHVCYLNFELFPGAVDWRIAQIRQELARIHKGDRFKPGMFHAWQLRGKKGLTLDTLANEILYRAWKAKLKDSFGLVILDPAYKLWQGKDEISSGEMGDVYGQLSGIPEEIDSALLACLHAPKGNNDKRRGLDLYSGHGVGGRSMDSAIALRIKHDDLDADPAPLTRVEVTRRHLVSPPPFCIRYDLEKNVLAYSEEAWGGKTKASGSGTSKDGEAAFDGVDLFDTPDTRLRNCELIEKFMLATGKGESTADNWRKKELGKGGILSKSGDSSATRYFLSPAGRKRWATRHPDAAATAGDLPLATGTDAPTGTDAAPQGGESAT